MLAIFRVGVIVRIFYRFIRGVESGRRIGRERRQGWRKDGGGRETTRSSARGPGEDRRGTIRAEGRR
jgi:hypothetical protein